MSSGPSTASPSQPLLPSAPDVAMRPRGATSRSRLTALLRLGVSVWLVGSGARIMAQPGQTADETGASVALLLPLGALTFTLGIFLFTGFMSRVGGVLLVGIGVWQLARIGISIPPAVYVLLGIYFALRGGGTWAMDVYVEKMQDRVRQREAREAAARLQVENAEPGEVGW